MTQQELVRRLANGIASAIRTTKFCVSGAMPDVAPGINVPGYGTLTLPLDIAAAKRLKRLCRQAPFGKGTKTLVDTRVRDTLELNPEQFSLTNPQWDEAILATVRSVANQLGLPADRLEAQLYKLLLYLPGGFFQPHRDSEKSDGMVGSLIVALPTPFRGGALTVRHQNSSERIDFQEAASGRSPAFAAFYADCEHEVSDVRDGYRLCLAYNLVLRAPARGRKPPAAATPAGELATALSSWLATAKAEPLVFALDHHYTQRGLSVDLLKGNDRATVDLVAAAAREAGCRTYLCQVERHILQDAFDGRWGSRSRYSAPKPKKLELGDVHEDSLQGTGWVDLAGKRQAFPEIDLTVTAIVATTPVSDWTPTREEYEGYTGNAGNTLDRWYHRSALCVWRDDDHYDVIAQSSVQFALGMLASMVARLNRTAKKRLDAARVECLRLAQAISRHWPRTYRHSYKSKTDEDQRLSRMPELIVELDDPQTANLFLRTAAPRDPVMDLDKLVVALCRKHGCGTFSDSLAALFETSEEGANVRDFAWLDRLARSVFEDPTRDALIAKLARSAAAIFCRELPRSPYYGEDPARAEWTLPELIRVLLIAGDSETLDQVIRFVTSHVERFSLDKVQVPCLQQVFEWSGKKERAVPDSLTKWLNDVKQDLMTATAVEPEPPADWSRPAELACTCALCGQLNQFLADPAASTTQIRAGEERRTHLLDGIRRRECDVTSKLDKTTRPFALVFTKTRGSFERKMQRYAADQRLLETVRSLEPLPQARRGR